MFGRRLDDIDRVGGRRLGAKGREGKDSRRGYRSARPPACIEEFYNDELADHLFVRREYIGDSGSRSASNRF